MADDIFATIQVKRDTDEALNLEVNPLQEGEPCYNTTTGKFVIGDGESLFDELPDIKSPQTYGVVAASNSTKKMRLKADYVCTGTDDQIKIQEALDDFTSIKTLPGMYDIQNVITVPEYGVFSGSGQGLTTLKLNKNHDISGLNPFIVLSSNSLCENMTINGNGWTDQDIDTNGIQLSDYSTLQNCEVLEPREYAVFTNRAKGARIQFNTIHHTKYPIALTAGTEDETLWSNGCIVLGNVTHTSDYYTKIKSAKNCIVSNNTFYQTTVAGGGVALSGADHPYKNINICDNNFIDILRSGTTSGIYIQPDSGGLSQNINICNNTIDGFYYGIYATVANLNIQNNTIVNSLHNGISLISCNGSNISQNNCSTGIHIYNSNNNSIKNNMVNGGVVSGNGVGSGILISCSSAITSDANLINNNSITGCTIGVYIYTPAGSGGPSNTIISRNKFWNNTTKISIGALATNTVITDNPGYKTENTGTATITASSTSVVVSHGLVAAPTKYFAFPSANLGNCWIDTVTATEMTIHCSSAPGADTTVSWSASV